MSNISASCYHVKLIGNTAAGTDANAVASDAIDVLSKGTFDRIRVVCELGAVTSGGKIAIAVKQCDTSTGTFATVAELESTVATGKSDNSIIIDCPISQQFIKIVYQRATANVELDGIMYDLYSSRKIPVTQNTAVWKEIIV